VPTGPDGLGKRISCTASGQSFAQSFLPFQLGNFPSVEKGQQQRGMLEKMFEEAISMKNS